MYKLTNKWLRRTLLLLAVMGAFGLTVYVTRDFWVKQIRAYFVGAAYVAAEDCTRNLPGVDRVEICLLNGDSGNKPIGNFNNGLEKLPMYQCTVFKGATARSVARAWRKMPYVYGPAFITLCHEPTYGLTFWHGNKRLLRTSICWKCGNFTLPVWPLHTTYPFDAKSPTAQELLTQLQGIVAVMGRQNTR